ncbi:YkgJ family cysteine cluster protein [Congregibacter sp.]|uniref:YkgJ family cysteine cluster protein n=1 Tax=Congregibacter sp. TaxID=2744308 RepID=UPI00385D2208
MICRKGCGACCIAPSISSPLPGMPDGKPAGIACINLDARTKSCKIWETHDYPKVCRDFSPHKDVCGDSREHAISLISILEIKTTQ